jgi:hypothetical protein
MLSNDASKPTFNATSHEEHSQTVNRKPSPLYTTQITSKYRTGTTHTKECSLNRGLQQIYIYATCQRSTVRCYGNQKLCNFKAFISSLHYIQGPIQREREILFSAHCSQMRVLSTYLHPLDTHLKPLERK